MQYLPRIVDQELQTRLQSLGAVVIEGPKACGKTETARQQAKSEIRLDVDKQARIAASTDPLLVLEGPTPRLIDEWQLEPELWNNIRRIIDDRQLPGQFILTGSSTPADEVTRHSGAMRFSHLRMRPMSLFETGHSTGRISLSSLFSGKQAQSPEPGLSVSDLADRIAVGGWPSQLGLSIPRATAAVKDYLEEIRRVDIIELGTKHRDPERMNRVFAALARSVSTYASINTLTTDIRGGAEGAVENGISLKSETVQNYLGVLERLLITENQPAWAPHIRSRDRLRSSPKRHFIDPSLAVAALGADSDRILKDLEWMGFLFESLVIRDLRIYGQAMGASVLQYKDNQVEVDAILELSQGGWAAFEVKLGTSKIDEAASNLKRFANRIDTSKCGSPAALGVIVGTGYGYLRPDGVSVIPIGALGP